MSDEAVRPAWAEEIRSKRLRLCWSQNELARQLVLAADERTRTQLPSRASIVREIRFHECGTHRPGPLYAELYRRVWASAPDHEEPTSDGGVLQGAGSALVELDDPTSVMAQARSLVASNVDHQVLDMVHRSIGQVVATYEGLGPWRLIGEMRSLRTTLHGLLDGRQPPDRRRELFLLAGQVSGLLAYMAVNIGRPLLAEAYGTEAEMLAREACDVELQMWVLGTRSFALYYEGRYDKADAAAAAAIGLAPSSPQAIRLLANGRARALARIPGDGERAEQVIGQALAMSDRVDGLPGGMSSCIALTPYSPARTMANAVTAFVSLGKSDQVLDYADQLDGLVEGSDSRWSKALVRLDVASALLAQRSPEAEQAMALGREALDITSAAPIQSVSKRARELSAQAGAWAKNDEVAAYRQRLLDWHAGPLASTVIEEAPRILG